MSWSRTRLYVCAAALLALSIPSLIALQLHESLAVTASKLKRHDWTGYVFYKLAPKKEIILRRTLTPAALGLKHGATILARFEGEHKATELESVDAYRVRRAECCSTCREPLNDFDAVVEACGRKYHDTDRCFVCDACFAPITLDEATGAPAAQLDEASGRVICTRTHAERPADVVRRVVERAKGTCCKCRKPVWEWQPSTKHVPSASASLFRSPPTTSRLGARAAASAASAASGPVDSLAHVACLTCAICYAPLQADESGGDVFACTRDHTAVLPRKH